MAESKAQPAFSAKKLAASDTRQLVEKAKLKGRLHEAWNWKDQLGDNFLVLFHIPKYKSWSKEMEEEATSIELTAFLFVKTDTGYKQIWKLADYVRECVFDVLCEFFNGSVSITDLDNNGKAEVTLLYKLSCRSDVSPDEMKLIMREDNAKYALRGLTCDPGNGEQQKNCATGELNLSKMPKPKEDDYELAFGRYQSEKDFEKAPASFLTFARKEWVKYVSKF